MGRYVGPVCRICRREGMKLFLKGSRCNMSKCPVEAGRAAPGIHGARRTKMSDYARQFREKQRLRKFYGLQNGQFMRFFQKAVRSRGITGELLLQALEMRLDNLVYRFGFAQSRSAARQFVLHKHILVNGRISDIPSMVLKAGDNVEVNDNKKSRNMATRSLDASEEKSLSGWLALDKAKMQGEVLHIPAREEIAPLVDEQLVVELCSK